MSLLIWIVVVISIGSIIGSLSKPEMNIWYKTLNRSTLTPPGYVFGITWTILYSMIGLCGWIIWSQRPTQKLISLKSLYLLQLFLNWTWTPLFFKYHFIGLSLICIIAIKIFILKIIYFSFNKIRIVSMLMIPYFIWIFFATYLNFYIWLYN